MLIKWKWWCFSCINGSSLLDRTRYALVHLKLFLTFFVPKYGLHLTALYFYIRSDDWNESKAVISYESVWIPNAAIGSAPCRFRVCARWMLATNFVHDWKNRQFFYFYLFRLQYLSLPDVFLTNRFLYISDTTEILMTFFLKVFQALRRQLGVEKTAQILELFMECFSSEQLQATILHEDPAGVRVIEKSVKTCWPNFCWSCFLKHSDPYQWEQVGRISLMSRSGRLYLILKGVEKVGRKFLTNLVTDRVTVIFILN